MSREKEKKKTKLTDEELNMLPLEQKERILKKRKIGLIFSFIWMILGLLIIPSAICCASIDSLKNVFKIITWMLIGIVIFTIFIIAEIGSEEEKMVEEINIKIEKEKIQKAKDEAAARGEVYVENSTYFISKFTRRDASECPVCGEKIEKSWPYYNATETQKVELPGVYVTKSYGNEVEQAVTYKKVNDDFIAQRCHCPKCGYSFYSSTVSYYEHEEYTVQEDDGPGTWIGWTRKTYDVFALDKGKITEISYENLMKELNEKIHSRDKIVNSSEFNDKKRS